MVYWLFLTNQNFTRAPALERNASCFRPHKRQRRPCRDWLVNGVSMRSKGPKMSFVNGWLGLVCLVFCYVDRVWSQVSPVAQVGLTTIDQSDDTQSFRGKSTLMWQIIALEKRKIISQRNLVFIVSEDSIAGTSQNKWREPLLIGVLMFYKGMTCWKWPASCCLVALLFKNRYPHLPSLVSHHMLPKQFTHCFSLEGPVIVQWW